VLRKSVVVVTEAPDHSRKDPSLRESPASALLLLVWLPTAKNDCGSSSISDAPAPMVEMPPLWKSSTAAPPLPPQYGLLRLMVPVSVVGAAAVMSRTTFSEGLLPRLTEP
jgi:hypothetical protein